MPKDTSSRICSHWMVMTISRTCYHRSWYGWLASRLPTSLECSWVVIFCMCNTCTSSAISLLQCHILCWSNTIASNSSSLWSSRALLAPIYGLMVSQGESLGNSTALQQQFRTIIRDQSCKNHIGITYTWNPTKDSHIRITFKTNATKQSHQNHTQDKSCKTQSCQNHIQNNCYKTQSHQESPSKMLQNTIGREKHWVEDWT